MFNVIENVQHTGMDRKIIKAPFETFIYKGGGTNLSKIYITNQ